ncbi:MAG: trypsin-like peptidase domain-containing protein [Chloroflexi bacterium]|nr:trypsin-like peptidase domain-containing protein [Chloroflexota bacterium]
MKIKISRLIVIITMVSILLVSLLNGCTLSKENATNESNNTNSSSLTTISSTVPLSFAEVVSKIMPSVVYIQVNLAYGSASGSGVIMKSDGYILTNRHVVEGATAKNIEVTLQDRTSFIAANVWTDNLTDLAVIKIDPGSTTLSAATFADPAQIHVGDWAIALGHPLGLSPSEGGATVTAGIVSNLGRSFTISSISYYDIIQTDAAISAGNSGGPLVNLNGEVIGINSAISGQGQNIGYAINVNTARRVYEDLSNDQHKVTRPYLGAAMVDISPDMVKQYSLTPKIGALISSLTTNGPAAKANLQTYDVIVKFGDLQITSVAQLITNLWTHKVGDNVEVQYYRGSDLRTTTVTLIERTN